MGVVRTRVGYCGGAKSAPTYHSLGRHTEAFEVDYDPDQITYEQLLTLFFRTHTAHPSAPRQYRSAIFFRTDAERAIAETVRAQYQPSEPYGTAIEPLGETKFWLAENYHQKYILRQSQAFVPLKGVSNPDVIAEPFMTKMIALAGRHLSPEAFLEQCTHLYLPEVACEMVTKLGGKRADYHFSSATKLSRP